MTEEIAKGVGLRLPLCLFPFRFNLFGYLLADFLFCCFPRLYCIVKIFEPAKVILLAAEPDVSVPHIPRFIPAHADCAALVRFGFPSVKLADLRTHYIGFPHFWRLGFGLRQASAGFCAT